MSYRFFKNCLKSSLFSTFLLFLQPGSAQQNWADLDAELQTRQKLLGTNFVFMVWKKGDTLVHKKEMGDLNSKTAAPIGAASTWLTAALVMQFVDEGKLSLDDKVSQWLPEFAKYGKNYITLRTCLSHLTGISDKKSYKLKKFPSLEEEVDFYASREIRANPTEDFWYGDIGPAIAGRVLEIVGKKKFDLLIKQKLFNVMAMRRSTFSTIDASAVSPGDGAQSSADDYIRFLVMLLNKGKYEGKQILSEESVDQLLQIQMRQELVKYAPKAGVGLNYALGSWVLEEKGDKPVAFSSIGLTGSWPIIDLCHGYASLIIVKTLQNEQKPEPYLQIKATVDAQFTNTCP